jgi:geranylgeranyl diphosphate synthase, type II
MPRLATATYSSAIPQSAPALWELDRAEIERELGEVLHSTAPANPVQACMEYAVLGEAQRVRPLLAVRVGRICGAKEDLVLRAAAAVEILHSASLIVDDLPSMDNEAMRRGQPAAHVAFGEPTALLAAFGLVALAARSVTEQPCAKHLMAGQRRFQHALLRTLDCASLIGGQLMDLQLTGARREADREAMNELKTVPLFLLAVEAGTAYADSASYPLLKRFGREYGVAFQLTDDYLDGELKDRSRLSRQFDLTRECLAPFGAGAQPLAELLEYLEGRAAAQDRRHR